jgi:thiamine-monophosphate kinase
MNEFKLISELFSQLGVPADNNLRMGVGDDAAVFSIPANTQVVMSVDTAVEGIHFPEDGDAQKIGYRIMAAAVSDLAAMGATPSYFSLCVSVPKGRIDSWLPALAKGLGECASQYEMSVIGGDTTRSEQSVISVQVFGRVEHQYLSRGGAKVGHDIYVSNTLGDGAGALPFILNEQPHNEHSEKLVAAYYRPHAQITLGRALLGVASSCIDLSDGLIQDITHIMKQSDVGADINVDEIPMSNALVKTFGKPAALSLALAGGDDYQLCFTAAPDQHQTINEIAKQLGIPLAKIGKINDSNTLTTTEGGNVVNFEYQGYQHF